MPVNPWREYHQRYRNCFLEASLNTHEPCLIYIEDVAQPPQTTSEEFTVNYRKIKPVGGDVRGHDLEVAKATNIHIKRSFPNTGLFKYKQAPYYVYRTANKQYFRAFNRASMNVGYPLTFAISAFSKRYNNNFWKDFHYEGQEKYPYALAYNAFYPQFTKLQPAIDNILNGRSFCEILSQDFYVFPEVHSTDQLGIFTMFHQIASININRLNEIIFSPGVTLDQEFIDYLSRTGQLHDYSIRH